MKLRIRLRTVAVVLLVGLLAVAGGIWRYVHVRYAVAETMDVPLLEFSNAEYPEDPAARSVHFGQYAGRALRLVQNDDTHFDFVFEPDNPHTATVVFRDVDVSLMTPSEPEWTKRDPHLERIALTDRQWNRQQVSFAANSRHAEVTGGDGFEAAHLYSAELAKNCLNAGLWEVLLFTREHDQKTLYYQGWFTFPLGHYKRVFEHNTGRSYRDHWYKLEHWSDPVGTPLDLSALRKVLDEREVEATFDTSESVIVAGEQERKRRTTMADNVLRWGDFLDGREVSFATFAPPGRYVVAKPWNNEFRRLAKFDKAIWREIVSPATEEPLSELELVFRDPESGEPCRFLVSGFDTAMLPRLEVSDYPRGMYMPMGIGVPPFFQSYEDLQKSPPHESPYFCVLLDTQDRWINHHEVAVDGPVIHCDVHDPSRLHVYLLSYERHTLIGHFVVPVRGGIQTAAR